jgi:hypothetical protein
MGKLMPLQSLQIGPFQTGLDTDLEPWTAPPDSFSEADNVHIHHGYIEKRQGYGFFGVLEPMGSTIAITGITRANPGVVATALAHGYTTGDKVYITDVTGMTEVNNKIYTITETALADEFSINLDTSTLTAYGAGGTVAATDVTTDRVMGITRYNKPGGGKTTLAFNARKAYWYSSALNTFDQLDAVGANIFNSGEEDYVWSTNWQSGSDQRVNRLYFTNGLAGTPANAPTADGIRHYDEIVSATTTKQFNPTLSPAATAVQRTLVGAKLLFTIGQRLVVLSTNEYTGPGVGTVTNYPQRARWCAKQNPENWIDTVAGGGGFADAATGDQIVSARAIQNQIIVFFTNSVWSLVSTNDPNRAFRWQRINDFRACDGKMATIGYDRYVVALGNRGITATDGVETRRIDNRIEDFTTDVINFGEFGKVFCERSYTNTRWWTLFNNNDATDNENNSALIYDDDSNAYTTYEIKINCLGYGDFTKDYGLDDFTIANGFFDPETGEELTLEDYDEKLTLQSYFWQDGQEALLGGDLNGSVFIMEQDGDDYGGDISSTFTTAAWNPFKDEPKECQLNYVDIYVDTELETEATLEFYKDTNQAPYASQQINFLPNLNFVTTIIGATQANPVSVSAPDHGLVTGDVIYIYGVAGMTDINSGGSAISYTITVVDTNTLTLDGIDGTAFNTYVSGGGIYLRKFYKTKTWKRVYAGGIGFQHRFKFTSSGKDKAFKIHGYKPTFRPIGRRLVN